MDRQGETAGERRTEDDWWHDLYAEGVPDTGPQRAGDTLDDRFASVARAVDAEAEPLPAAPPGPAGTSRPSAAEPYDQMRDPDYPPLPAPSGTAPEAPSVAGVPGFTERAEPEQEPPAGPAAGRGWADDVFAGMREDLSAERRLPEPADAADVPPEPERAPAPQSYEPPAPATEPLADRTPEDPDPVETAAPGAWESEGRTPGGGLPPAPGETGDPAPAEAVPPGRGTAAEPGPPEAALPAPGDSADPAPVATSPPGPPDAVVGDPIAAPPSGPRKTVDSVPEQAAPPAPRASTDAAPARPEPSASPVPQEATESGPGESAPSPRAPRPAAGPSAPASPVPPGPAASGARPAAGTSPPPATMRLRQVSVTDTLTDADWSARRAGSFVGGGPPTYEAEPTTLPEVAPGALGELVPDTVLDGARYGSFTLRTAATRGDSPRYRGEQRRDAVLTARFGGGDDALVLVAVATGARGVPRTDRAATSLVRWMGEAVGRSRARLSEDIRTGRRAALKAGLHRLTGRTYGLLRAQAEEFGVDPAEYTAGLRCLLLSTDAACRTRVFFGTGPGGLFRLRDDGWQDLEPAPPDGDDGPGAEQHDIRVAAPPAAPVDPRVAVDLGARPPRSDPAGPPPPGFGAPGSAPPPAAAPGFGALVPSPDPGEPAPFVFRASEGRPGDVLLLCSPGFAEPLRGAPGLADALAERWRGEEAPPGLAAFLGDVQLRAKGFADDRTAAALWES